MNNKVATKWITKLSDADYIWTESDIIYFRKAIGLNGIKDSEVRRYLMKMFDKYNEQFDGFRITGEQQQKGTNYLVKNTYKQNGELRKGNKLGQVEREILSEVVQHRLDGMYYHGGYFLPVYKAIDVKGNWFTYIGTQYEQLQTLEYSYE